MSVLPQRIYDTVVLEAVEPRLLDHDDAQAGWTVCAKAANGREAVERAIQSRPRVAVLDFSMPELNGLEATRRIRQAAPETEVLIFTMHESEELIREVLAAGARGYVLKSDATRQLIPAVESVSRHMPYFSGRVSAVVLDGFLKGRPAQPVALGAERLTSREREIVQLLAEGNSNKAIASRLDLSVKTVETHRAQLMQRLNIRDVPGLVRYALRVGLVSPD